MKFTVQVEVAISKDIEVEADSHEEAVAKVRDSKPQGTREMSPRWVDTTENVESSGELAHEVIGECDWCLSPLVSRDIEGQPWLYTGNPENEHGGLVCFPCMKKKGYVDETGKRLKDF